ncbi:MAG: hypothetical protein KA264_05500 [Crocinitomicaceae bacterium]|jgi:hypothetical protein|nr:hypothetical protein [Crocinitomicaceae bacterium]
MTSNVIFYGIAKMLQTSFLFYEFIQNKFNYACIILGFIGLFYWLNYQRKFNQEAQNNPNQIK